MLESYLCSSCVYVEQVYSIFEIVELSKPWQLLLLFLFFQLLMRTKGDQKKIKTLTWHKLMLPMFSICKTKKKL